MNRMSVLLVGVAFAALAGPALAQTTDQPVAGAKVGLDDTSVGEIVVTAQKTSEKLSKAPIAVSVVSQEALTRQGVDSAAALTTTVPGLQSSSNGFAIRGIGSNNGFSGYSTVATQIDGIYDPSAAVLTFGLFDVGSIEVLRGPQGTVYGRNATAGVVNINTADPSRRLGGGGELQYGRFNEFKARASVDLPVSDALSLRASVFRQVDDGVDDKYAASENYGKTDQFGLRLNSLLHVGDSLTWRLSLNYGKNRSTVPATYLRSINTYPSANLAAGVFGPVSIIPTDALNPGQDLVTDNRQDLTYYAARSRLTLDVTDTLSLTYLAGYSVLKDDGVNAATGVFSQQAIDRRTETMSHELDANFSSGPVQFVMGGYLYEDKQPSGTRLLHAGDTAPAPFNSVFNALGAKVAGVNLSTVSGVDVVNTYRGQGSKSQALFGQGTFEIMPGLKILAGARATWEQVNARQIELVCPGDTVTLANISPTTCPGIPFVYALSNDVDRPEAKFSNKSWKLGVNYEVTDETLVYATVSTGFRGGGLEASSNAPQYRQYRPETVTNTEAGVRSTMLEGKLYLAATAFNMDYKDLQVSSVVLNPLTNQVSAVTTNAATARLRGVELEATFRPTAHDRFSGYLSYLNARVRSFPTASDNVGSGGGTYNALAPILGNAPLPANLILDVSGNALPNAPDWSARFSYAHIFNLANGVLTPSVDVYVQSRTFSDVQNYKQSRRPSYTKTDLNLRYEDNDGRYAITGFVNNLEDESVPNSMVSVWSSTTANYDPPRTYGVRLSVNF